MMKTLLLLVTISATCLACSDTSNRTVVNSLQIGDAKYQEVMQLKEGFTVSHNPSEVEATLNGRSGQKYTWLHTTTVEANEKISIVEFGAFNYINGQWKFGNYTGKPFKAEDFEKWYNCPNGEIQANTKYSDHKNWKGSNHLEKGEALWYYIGKTEAGELVRATAPITFIPAVRF